MADGRGVVGHAGTRLLADIADATGLSGGFSAALKSLRRRDRGHDPGRIAVDVAVMLADGGQAIADLAVLRDQQELFGAVALCFLDATGEALAGLLREGRAGSNTTADHITVLDAALAQLPDQHRYGTEIFDPLRLGRI
jgi:hypothetical protein